MRGVNRIINSSSFSLEKGKIYALVGDSGSGKSTLLDSIAGLQSNTTGKVIIGNHELAINEYSNLLRQFNLISYIPQEIFLIDGTIKENILLTSNKRLSNFEAKELIKQLNLNDLSKNKDEILNFKIAENGLNLSGGQKQRIGIARGLLDKNKIILMDESTNALNEKLQKSIFYFLKKNIKDKIIIIATHRESLIKLCDSKIKIDKKSINIDNYK